MASSFTESQRRCIESLDTNLVISAGAGTGKTFTLTQKISWMLENHVIGSIDEVLAITFTKKAASEIKTRVRSMLRSKGMRDQAVLVDGAWISTIHSMCSRILKEHALEFGIDPVFEDMSDLERDELLDMCIEETVAGRSAQPGSDGIDELSAVLDPDEIKGCIRSLIDMSVLSELGFSSVEMGPAAHSPKTMAMGLVDRLKRSISELEELHREREASKRPSDAYVKALTGAISARTAMIDALERAISGEDAHQDVCKVIASFGKSVSKKLHHSYAVENAVIGEDAQWVSGCCVELLGGIEQAILERLVNVASAVSDMFDAEKARLGKLDNNDLLILALRCLDEHPEVSRAYRERFSLILVDEFQDTSSMQIKIIDRLFASERAQLCTVGDAQQSIYRFRGADVNVYERFIGDSGAEPVELEVNFRSHPDILAFSNSIFGQDGVFDRRFLRLVAGKSWESGEVYSCPRVNLILTTRATTNGAKVDDARRFGAAEIAERLARMREGGARPEEMVVLLGRMSNAAVYTDALKARGFDVVIAGGSGFWETPESAMVGDMLAVLANPLDDAALFGLMSSGLLPIGDDCLLRVLKAGLSVKGRSRVSAGVSELARRFEEGEDDPESPLGLLCKLIRDARKMMGHARVSEILEWIVTDSGHLAHLQEQGAQGSASAANILKAIRFVEDQEDRGERGAVELSRTYAKQREANVKSGPGTLINGEGSAVRIMTIHASKGLEFPIVALADFEMSSGGGSKRITAQMLDGRSYAKVACPNEIDGLDLSVLKELSNVRTDADTIPNPATELAEASSYSNYARALLNFERGEEFAEARRKLYVGITRASQALIVLIDAKKSNSKNASPGKRIKAARNTLARDICTALFDAGVECDGTSDVFFPEEDVEFDYGGSIPGVLNVVDLIVDESGKVQVQDRPGYEPSAPDDPPDSVAVPEYRGRRGIDMFFAAPAETRGMFSYSSISEFWHGEGGVSDSESPSTEASTVTMHDGGAVSSDGSVRDVDGDSATDVGSAFHAIAEFMVTTGLLGRGEVSPPSRERVEAIARFYNVTSTDRLERAVSAWVTSDVATRAASYPNIGAEVPFCIEFPSGADGDGPALLNGELDLLCTDSSGECAFVVDYKTGGTVRETPEALRDKHMLQSMCYAYALLRNGVREIDMVFVRVEQIEKNGQPQTVWYRYTSDDLDRIEGCIAEVLTASYGTSHEGGTGRE